MFGVLVAECQRFCDCSAGQWFSTEAICPPGDIQQSLEIFGCHNQDAGAI